MRIPVVITLLVIGGCQQPEARPEAGDQVADEPNAGPAGVVYTADEAGNTVTAVDLATGESKQVPVPLSPHNIQISGDGRLLFVVGPVADNDQVDITDDHDGEGRLVILNAATLAEHAVVEAGIHPAHVVAGGDNRFAYITDSAADVVLAFDLRARNVAARIPTCAYPHGLRMSPDEREVYVACVEDDQVSVIAVADRAEVSRIDVGRAPIQVGFTADGRHVYVTLRDEDAAAVIDTRTRAVVHRIAVGRGPIQVFATPDSRFVYVANEGTRQHPDSTVSVIDAVEMDVHTTLVTGAGAHGVVVSDDGRYAFISNLFAGTVSVIDVAAQRVVRTIPVGEGPAGITYRPPASGSPGSGRR